MRPFIFALAGVNGAGKSSVGGTILREHGLDWFNPDTFARWVKVYDRVSSGEMPPPKQSRPPKEELAGFLQPHQTVHRGELKSSELLLVGMALPGVTAGAY